MAFPIPSNNTVMVLLGNTDGPFTPTSGSPFAVASTPGAMAAGDLDRDGKADLVVVNGGSNTLTVLQVGKAVPRFSCAVTAGSA